MEKRIQQLGIDVIIPDGMTMDEVIGKMTKEFEKLGVEVIGFLPTDTSWTFEEYGLL